jgi:hypothetical protein
VAAQVDGAAVAARQASVAQRGLVLAPGSSLPSCRISPPFSLYLDPLATFAPTFKRAPELAGLSLLAHVLSPDTALPITARKAAEAADGRCFPAL